MFRLFCSLTVDLRARPLRSGVLVGGADGVSDGRGGLKQSEGGREVEIRKRVFKKRKQPRAEAQASERCLTLGLTPDRHLEKNTCERLVASSHYYAAPDAVCLQQALWLTVIQGFFIQGGQHRAAAVRGGEAQKALVPALWLPHRCAAESSGNNNVEGGGGSRRVGEGKRTKVHFSKAHL